MKANPHKCYLLMSTNIPSTIEIGDYEILASRREKLLGVIIDSKLNFNTHLDNTFKKVSQKVQVLARITSVYYFQKEIAKDIAHSFAQLKHAFKLFTVIRHHPLRKC